MTGALAAEWVKLRSVRSTWTVLAVAAAAAVVAALLTWQGVIGWDSLTAARRTRFQSPPMEQVLVPLVQLCLGVLGVVAVTGEYATGTIRASLAAVPRRWPVLAAKALVVAAVALAAGEVVELAIFLVSRAIIGGRPIPGNTAPLAQALPGLLVLGCSVMVVALVGLGLGAATRSTAGAIAGVATLLFVLPAVAQFVPPPWGGRIASVMLPDLTGAGQGALAVLAGGPAGAGTRLSPAAALLAMAGYAVAAVGAGWFAICRRDV
jgi:ABC-type transport system involved in multi-copper enzyme maturation permease subunit